MGDMVPSLGSPASSVVITGGASGLGFASARALAAVGRPVVLWDLDQGRSEKRAQDIAEEFGVTAAGLAVDVRDLTALSQAAERTRTLVPQVGGLVHCAGVVDTDNLDGLTQESWDSGIAVHLRALAFLVQAFLPDLKAAPGGAVVATASINATLGNAINPVYTAGKGGVLSLVRSLADRLGRDGVRINAVSPGQIRTPMMQPALDNLGEAAFENRILLGRIGVPEEIGRVVRFLLSDEASYITAAEIVVDGGNISSQR
jgi:NAD(P)-dependent dehydrogenase (short-subunit alcohol dehydrogenase family)